MLNLHPLANKQVWFLKISHEYFAAACNKSKDNAFSRCFPIIIFLKWISGGERTCKLSELTCFVRYRKEIMALSVSNETLKKFSSSAHLPRTPKDCSCLSSCETDIYRKDREEYTPEPSSSRLRIIFTAFPKMRIVRDKIFSFSDIFCE